MADISAALEKEAEEIRKRIEPALAAIKADQQQLARIEAALEILRGRVAIASGAGRATRASGTTSRGGIDDDAIVSFVRANQPVAQKQIRNHLGMPDDEGNRLTVKLTRMIEKGLLTKTGERRGTRYSVA